MKDNNIKERIDTELNMIKVNEKMKQNIGKSLFRRSQHKVLKTVAASLAVLMLGGTTVAAGYYFVNKVSVNDEVLAKLDDMHVVDIKEMKKPKDEFGAIEQDFKDYKKIQEELGIRLLDTELANNNAYLQGHLTTDNKDYAMLTMENYIIGDTSNFRYLDEEGRYEYEHGKNYYSPVSLNVDLILSDEQLENGWDTDYLGMYESIEEYQSAQGYKVNLIQDTNGKERADKDVVSEKIAVFVSDGVRYTLKGRVSVDTMKEIVDTMK